MKILEVKLEYWVPGITIGASGTREENSFRDVTGICLNMHPGSFGGSKMLGLIGSLPANQVAVVSIHLF